MEDYLNIFCVDFGYIYKIFFLYLFMLWIILFSLFLVLLFFACLQFCSFSIQGRKGLSWPMRFLLALFFPLFFLFLALFSSLLLLLLMFFLLIAFVLVLFFFFFGKVDVLYNKNSLKTLLCHRRKKK